RDGAAGHVAHDGDQVAGGELILEDVDVAARRGPSGLRQPVHFPPTARDVGGGGGGVVGLDLGGDRSAGRRRSPVVFQVKRELVRPGAGEDRRVHVVVVGGRDGQAIDHRIQPGAAVVVARDQHGR